MVIRLSSPDHLLKVKNRIREIIEFLKRLSFEKISLAKSGLRLRSLLGQSCELCEIVKGFFGLLELQV